MATTTFSVEYGCTLDNSDEKFNASVVGFATFSEAQIYILDLAKRMEANPHWFGGKHLDSYKILKVETEVAFEDHGLANK